MFLAISFDLGNLQSAVRLKLPKGFSHVLAQIRRVVLDVFLGELHQELPRVSKLGDKVSGKRDSRGGGE